MQRVRWAFWSPSWAWRWFPNHHGKHWFPELLNFISTCFFDYFRFSGSGCIWSNYLDGWAGPGPKVSQQNRQVNPRLFQGKLARGEILQFGQTYTNYIHKHHWWRDHSHFTDFTHVLLDINGAGVWGISRAKKTRLPETSLDTEASRTSPSRIKKSEEILYHRENGGTCGMVPLIINPIYTLYSGSLGGLNS